MMPRLNGLFSEAPRPRGSLMRRARAMEQILDGPQQWAAGPYGTRRYLLKRFPFLLIYREMSESRIEIVAFAHTSRRPEYWKSRIKH